MRQSDHTFSLVPSAEIPRSVFNRSHGYKTTCDAGLLIPFFVDEALPGDTFHMRLSLFGRMATPIVPVLDNLYCDVFWFAVPNRLLWSNWQKFCGEQENPGDSISFNVPRVNTNNAGVGFTPDGVLDYMGVPPGKVNIAVNALFPRAYNLVYDQWFRDENLVTRPVINMDDGPDLESDYPLRARGKRHDYFTSCLPWPQKQTTPVYLPLGTTAPVKGNAGDTTLYGATSGHYGPLQASVTNPTTSINIPADSGSWTAGEKLRFITSADTGLYADLSTATAATINQIREAFQIQKLLERDARGGTRYTEIVKAHFRVNSPDARLNRSEYLGGSSTPVQINPVQQTSAAAGQPTPQGNLAAFGTVGARGSGFVKSFTEHSVILGLLMFRADLTYQQGTNRMWNRLSRYDFYWPAFSHLGEQAVLNKEIWQQDAAQPTNDQAFGYQERWAEYRYAPSLLTSRFRSDHASTVHVWHLAQDFAALPVLNSAFILEDPPVDRVIAVPAEPHFLVDAWFDLKCARPMPVYSVPGLLDHF